MNVVQFNTITKAIQKMLKADPRLVEATIDRSELLNEDTSKCPWVCIYRMGQSFEPRALGYGSGAYYAHPEIVIVAQESNATGGAETEDDLEDMVSTILDILFTDTTLGGTVMWLKLARIMYRMVQVGEDAQFQQAEIHITAELTTI